MHKNIEIEFKTEITATKYQEMLHMFSLENNIFKQINHYFDTDTFDLSKKNIVLRIRQKGRGRYKITLKSQCKQGAYESHIILTMGQAQDMIKNGFETKTFFSELDYSVNFKASLENYRVSTPYKGGTLFLDRCEYCGVIDYEVEYEVPEYDQGLKNFKLFLKTYNIEQLSTKRKSERAISCKIAGK